MLRLKSKKANYIEFTETCQSIFKDIAIHAYVYKYNTIITQYCQSLKYLYALQTNKGSFIGLIYINFQLNLAKKSQLIRLRALRVVSVF